jgi:tetratricopeptide (TPR) repeat protein
MHVYGTKDVERLAGISAAALRTLIRAGHVRPRKGRGGKHEFSFQDLIVLRTAQALCAAQLPTRRIVKCLKQLRVELPDSLPLSGLSITAVGDRVAVREGTIERDSESGQYLLALAVQLNDSELRISELTLGGQLSEKGSPGGDLPDGVDDYERACSLEDAEDMAAAIAAYERCLALNGDHTDARINCGRLLHVVGRLQDAERVYREAKHVDATLLFNLGTLLEDLGRAPEAAIAYRQALDADPTFADAHYNLACLHERAGNERDCLRHLMAYRRATRST